jgi:hypothetical protein
VKSKVHHYCGSCGAFWGLLVAVAHRFPHPLKQDVEHEAATG